MLREYAACPSRFEVFDCRIPVGEYLEPKPAQTAV